MLRLLKLQVKQSQLCGFVDIIIAGSNTYVLMIEVKESVMMRFKMKHAYISRGVIMVSWYPIQVWTWLYWNIEPKQVCEKNFSQVQNVR